MSQFYQLPSQLGSQIVEGITAGYAAYLGERKRLAQRLTVSASLVWMRSNFIDSHVAQAIQDYPGISYRRILQARSWEYLLFSYEDNGETTLFLVKNYATAVRNFSGNPKAGRPKNYLFRLAFLNGDEVQEETAAGDGTEAAADGASGTTHEVALALDAKDESVAAAPLVPRDDGDDAARDEGAAGDDGDDAARDEGATAAVPTDDPERMVLLAEAGQQLELVTANRFYLVNYLVDEIRERVVGVEVVRPEFMTMEMREVQGLSEWIQ
ncbi:hypothetical protein [Lacticaseibacillus parakribbianus]|uniref:hypothetical protein n=1 Tax=Lacticaseibacillus parakribbianus TaxID=2970927 RepID=UPI0021CB7AD9|nr:hypothetical protein [Lacticaseibacillus parakribbianus]